MKSKWMKKILSLFLAALMVCSIMPMGTITVLATSQKTLYQYVSSTKQMIPNSKVVLYGTGKDKVGKIKISEGFKLIYSPSMVDDELYNYKTLYYRIAGSRMYIGSCKDATKWNTCDIIAKVHWNGEYKVKNVTKIDTFMYRVTTNYIDTIQSFSNRYDYGDRVYFKDSKGQSNNINSSGSTEAITINAKKGKSSNATTTQEINATTTNPSGSINASVSLLSGLDSIVSFFKPMTVYAATGTIRIPRGTTLTITEVSKDEKYGKTVYKGTTCWVNLNYVRYVAPTITKPDPPTVTLSSEQDIPLGGLITVDWNTPTDAKYFSAILKDENGKVIKRQDDIYGNSISFQAENPGKYTVEVIAHNSMYSSDPGKLGRFVTIHDLVTVTFLDSDGETVLGTERIPWGKNAVAVIAPEKAGYTFRSWDKSLSGIKKDTVITAQYDKTKFKVQFIGYQTNEESESNIPSIEKPIGEPQVVEYGQDAAEPDISEIPIPKNYEFIGWSSEKYKNVYSPYKDETIKIYAVYGWKNKNLPVECEIVKAERQTNGYYVYYNLTNYPDEITRGRVIVALKTANGKLVDMTESSAFSLEKNETETNARIFVPCEKAATTAELYVVNGYTNNGMSDGIPISNMDSDVIIEGKVWSEWQTTPIVDPNAETQQREEYRFRNVHIETAHTSKKPYGWVTLMKDNTIYKGKSQTYQERSLQSLDETYTYVKDYTQAKRDISWGNWSAYSWTKYEAHDNESNKREIRQQNNVPKAWKTQYNYSRWSNKASGGSRFGPCAGTWSNIYCGNYQEHGWTDSPLQWVYTEYSGQVGGNFSCYNSRNNPWYNQNTRQVVSETGIQYSYRDGFYNYTFYYWDDDWSNWSPDEVAETTTREIDTRTVYREKKTSADEDVSGEEREATGNVGEEYAGKNIMLFVSKYNAISDFTDEYVAQSKVADDGSYYFKYTLREEPSVETGDFTVMIGLEGSTQKQIVETIEAPKPVYTVRYYDNEKSKNPHILHEVKVRQGDAADVPVDNPEIEGMRFICWNDSCTNVQSNMDVYPVLEPEEYIVTFVDTRNGNEKPTVNPQRFHYGDDLVAPTVKVEVETEEDESGETVLVDGEIADVESGKNGYWDFVEGTKVTSDMVVYSKYTTKQYNVTFYDEEGNVVDEQTVEYDGVAEAPELPDDENDGVVYYDWDIEPEELYGVKENIAVFPIYEYSETTTTPTASIETGAYDSEQTVTLDCEDENAVIYYTTDGTEPKDNFDAFEYTSPITIDSKTELKFYSSSIGKNDSDTVTEYYVINNDGVIINMHDNVYGEEGVETYLIDKMADFDDSDFEIDGYTLDGVYSDSEYTQEVAFDAANTTKGMIDLYAKYNINSYNVTFAKEDGTIIDTQTVEYTESAEAPDVADEGTMKFVGWDSNEWESVTKDLTIHPIFKDESEIINVTFDKAKYQMELDSTYQINATITAPDNDEYEDLNDAVVWYSDNEEVATVDNTGMVTSVGAGTANIYAVSVDDINSAVCEITVKPSVNNSILINNLSALDVDSEGYLRRIPLDGTNTVDNISANFLNDNSQLTFTNNKGNAISGEDKVGTNTVISLMNGDKVLDTMTVVMTGDITCDGLVNNRDVSYAARVIVKRNTADSGQLRAMDVNGDGKVNNRDVAMLSRYLVGKEQISN